MMHMYYLFCYGRESMSCHVRRFRKKFINYQNYTMELYIIHFLNTVLQWIVDPRFDPYQAHNFLRLSSQTMPSASIPRNRIIFAVYKKTVLCCYYHYYRVSHDLIRFDRWFNVYVSYAKQIKIKMVVE